MRSKLKFGSVPRSRWIGTPARPRTSRQAVRLASATRPSAGRRRAGSPSSSSARGCRRRGSGDGEAGAAPARRLDAELPAQPLERRVERVEAASRTRGSGRARRAGPSAPRSARGGRTPRRDRRPADAVRLDLLPGASRVRNVVAEAEVARAERVEHPAGAPLDVRRDQRNAAFTTRASCVAPGLGIVEREHGLDVRRSLEGGRSRRRAA